MKVQSNFCASWYDHHRIPADSTLTRPTVSRTPCRHDLVQCSIDTPAVLSNPERCHQQSRSSSGHERRRREDSSYPSPGAWSCGITIVVVAPRDLISSRGSLVRSLVRSLDRERLRDWYIWYHHVFLQPLIYLLHTHVSMPLPRLIRSVCVCGAMATIVALPSDDRER
mgnify:CR=1 FL=1